MVDIYEMPPYVVSRVRYFNGAFLKDIEFIDEQKYHMDRRQRHDRLLHVAGICEGLMATHAGENMVKVSAGTAVDDLGRQILVDSERTIDVRVDWSGKGRIEILFHEREDRVVTAEVDGAVEGATRFTQSPLLQLTQSSAARTPHAVVLGQALIVGGKVSEVTAHGREYSGVSLPGPEGKRYALRAQGDDNPGWAQLGCSLQIKGDVRAARYVGESLVIQGSGLEGDLAGSFGGDVLMSKSLDVRGTFRASGEAELAGPLVVGGRNVLTELVPVGTVLPWWRPTPDVPLPSGFEVCDGRTIPPDQHDFRARDGSRLTSAITLPDLRNAFIVGADPAAAQGSAATLGDLPGNAPGIGGAGGSNVPRSIDHRHDVALNHRHEASTTNGASRTMTALTPLRTDPAGEHPHEIGRMRITEWDEVREFFDLAVPVYALGSGGGAPEGMKCLVPVVSKHNTGTESSHHHTVPAHDHEIDHTHTSNALNYSGVTKSELADAKSIDVIPRYVGLLMIIRIR